MFVTNYYQSNVIALCFNIAFTVLYVLVMVMEIKLVVVVVAMSFSRTIPFSLID